MNTSLDATLASNAAQNADMIDKQRMLDTARRDLNAGAPKDKNAKLREACEGFESVFIQKMWEQMQATVPQEGYLHSKEEKHWQGMYNQELGKKMAASGGIGLADMMMEQLGKNLHDASRTTASSGLNRREPMPIEPAPLMPSVAAAPEADKQTAQQAARQKATPANTAFADLYSAEAPTVATEGSALSQTLQSIENELNLSDTSPEPSPFDKLVERIETESMAPVIQRTIYQTNIPEKMNRAKGPRIPATQPLNGRMNPAGPSMPIAPANTGQAVSLNTQGLSE